MYKALFHKIHECKVHLLVIHLQWLLTHVSEPSENERDALLEGRDWQFYKNPKRNYELTKYYLEYENDDIINIFDFSLSGLRCITKNGLQVLADTASKYYNVINNMRVTTDNPPIYKNNVFFFGNCNAVGCFAEDKFTIASQLQRKFNASHPKEIRVINASNWTSFYDSARQILSPKYQFKPGDFVVVITHAIDLEQCAKALQDFQDTSFYTYYDFSNIFERPHEYGEILFDNLHMSHNGYTILASHLYDSIIKLMSDKKNKCSVANYLTSFEDYISRLSNEKRHGADVCGSIVMNCNPFTCGHKFIVYEALKRCDHLYIFILEEDKSFFKFHDRIEMVSMGLQGLERISILPSGKMLISSDTLPEYFEKESLQDVKIDTSYDLELFSTLIAPVLNITKRFAGSEPLCKITRQYNDGMREILPRHGIEFVELPRYCVDGNEVSASLVREYIKTNDHMKIKKIVPQSTYDYLCEKNFIL